MPVVKFFLTVAALSFSLMIAACAPDEKPAVSIDPAVSSAKAVALFKEQARTNLEAGKVDAAAKAFLSVLKLDESDDESRLGLAECYLRLGKNDQAYNTYQELVVSEEYKSEVLQGIGLVELQRGNFEAAEVSFKQALEEDSSLWRSWSGLGQVYDFQRNWIASAEAYNNALSYTPTPYLIYNNRGVSYMAQKAFKEAADMFQKALRDKPDLEIASTNYKLALAMQDKYDEATLQDSDAENEAKALNNAGYAAMRQGKYKEAEKLFIKSLEVNPSFYKTPYYNLQVLNQLKQKQKAVE